jgi:hypothetical protein
MLLVKNTSVSSFLVAVTDATQPLGISPLRIEHDELDDLIADQAGAAIDRLRENAPALEVRLGTGDEEAAGLMQGMQALEVEIATVHDVERTGLRNQQIEHIDVVQLAIADVDEGRDGTTQVEQRVQLDGRLGGPKRCPGEQRQAQIDGRGIQCVDRVVEVDRQSLAGVQSARDPDQRLGELEMDAPVAALVGVGQGTATDIAADAQVIELRALRPQAGFDVAQALAVGRLRERHAQELIQATEAAHVEVAAILVDQPPERMPRRKLHHLRKHELAAIHLRLPTKAGNAARRTERRSSR